MKDIKIKKIMIALLMVSATHIAMGSFTGTTEKNTTIFILLKTLIKTSTKHASPFSLRAGFEYKGVQLFSTKERS